MDNPFGEAIFLPLLRAWIGLSGEHAIPYSIYWGTLLGQVRNQRIIPYDTDVDAVVGKRGLEIVHQLPRDAPNCFYNDALGEAPPWRDGEIRLVVKRDLLSPDADRYDRTGRVVSGQVDSCAFNGPLARLILKAAGRPGGRELWHLDIDLFTALPRLIEYPRPDEVDELPELEPCLLEGLSVTRLKEPRPFLVKAYGPDYMVPDHRYENGVWVRETARPAPVADKDPRPTTTCAGAASSRLDLPLIDGWLTHWADPIGPCRPPPARSLSRDELRHLLHAAEMHGVLAAVLQNGGGTIESQAGDDTVLAEARAHHHAAIGFSLMLSQQANTLIGLIGDLPASVVKGPVFARRLYPDRRLRRFTDIDVLAEREAIPALNEALGQLGFRLAEAQPAADPREWKWAHGDRGDVVIEVHEDLVHASSLRGAISLTYREIAAGNGPHAAERPASLLAIAAIHGATHNFERLLHVVDVLQAARAIEGPAEQAELERLIDRTGGRFAAAAGLDLAGRLFGEERCLALSRALGPVRYVRRARWLLDRTVVVSAMDRRRHFHSWRRALFRELVKRPQ
jgi:hypothetical protein